LALSIGIGCIMAVHVLLHQWRIPGWGSDLDQCFAGARALWAGTNPYSGAVIGPHGRVFVWPWRLYYPVPALILITPFTWMPATVARPVLMGVASAWLAYGLAGEDRWRLTALASGAMLNAVDSGTWEPLLVAAALTPGMAWLYLAKPNLGAALGAALRPSRAAAIGIGLGVLLLAASFAVRPSWLAEWRDALRSGEHIVPPALLPFGAIGLLALVRWKRADARLLAALTVVPQTLFPHAALPLFLIARTRLETLILVALSFVPFGVAYATAPITRTMAEQTLYVGTAIVCCGYLPALVMVLRRPNRWSSLTDAPAADRAGLRAVAATSSP
jgi:hypothetical protein